MAERLLIAAALKEESVSQCMLNTLSSDHSFSSFERKRFFQRAHLVHRQRELDIRIRKRFNDESSLPGRLIVVTPRKTGNAPQRNLIRRRLKAIFYEENLASFSYDTLIYCQKGSPKLPFADLKKLLLEIFSTLPTGTL